MGHLKRFSFSTLFPNRLLIPSQDKPLFQLHVLWDCNWVLLTGCNQLKIPVNDNDAKQSARYSRVFVATELLVLLTHTLSSRNGVLAGKQDQKCRRSSHSALYRFFSSFCTSCDTSSATTKHRSQRKLTLHFFCTEFFLQEQ